MIATLSTHVRQSTLFAAAVAVLALALRGNWARARLEAIMAWHIGSGSNAPRKLMLAGAAIVALAVPLATGARGQTAARTAEPACNGVQRAPAMVGLAGTRVF